MHRHLAGGLEKRSHVLLFKMQNKRARAGGTYERSELVTCAELPRVLRGGFERFSMLSGTRKPRVAETIWETVSGL